MNFFISFRFSIPFYRAWTENFYTRTLRWSCKHFLYLIFFDISYFRQCANMKYKLRRLLADFPWNVRINTRIYNIGINIFNIVPPCTHCCKKNLISINVYLYLYFEFITPFLGVDIFVHNNIIFVTRIIINKHM